MNDDKDLQKIFASTGAKYGYLNVEAAFVDCCDVKIKWMRSGTTIRFWITDYLKDAPEDILESLAETLFEKMYKDADARYSDEFLEYVSSDAFIHENQPIYLSRLEGASASPVGRYKDLRGCIGRLTERGLIDPLPHTYLGWLPLGLEDCIGHTSSIMRCACINTRLDRENVPDDVLDFCVYVQMLRIQQKFGVAGGESRRQFRKKIGEYPDSMRLMEEMGGFGLSLMNEVSP